MLVKELICGARQNVIINHFANPVTMPINYDTGWVSGYMINASGTIASWNIPTLTGQYSGKTCTAYWPNN